MLTSLWTTDTARTGDRSVKQKRDTQAALDCLFLLFKLLLDGIILELNRDYLAVAGSDGVETPSCLIWIEDDEFGEHQVAKGADVVLVLQTSDDAVVEVYDVYSGEGGFH